MPPWSAPARRRACSPATASALLVPGSPAYVDLVLALLADGVFPVPLDPALTEAERDRILEPIAPDLVVTSQQQVAQLLAARPGRSRSLPLGRPIHCTSGTTGTPKGVWSGLLPQQDAMALVAEERDLWGFDADDVNLVLSPLHHSAPLRFAAGTLLAGGRIVVPGKFDPAAVTAAIERERPTTMFCVPTHLQRLFDHWDAVGVPTCRRSGWSPTRAPPAPRRSSGAWSSCSPTARRGSSTARPRASSRPAAPRTGCARPGTVGRARPGRTLTTDDDGRIWCAVPQHARFTYLGAPEQTAAAWRDTPDGPAFTVGDVGRIDADGYLHLEGRRTDLVITGGVNVYPLEVENALREVTGVVDVAVFGVADPRWGQRVCAAVVGEATTALLRAHAEQVLAPAKRPKDYLRVSALPMTATGKVRRDALTELV